MLPGSSDLAPLALALLVPFLTVLLTMPRFIRLLVSKGRVGTDVHKLNRPSVAQPAGPLLIIALIAGEITVYIFYRSPLPLVILGVIAIAGAVGLYDDFFVLGGRVKPALLVFGSVPMLLAELLGSPVYTPSMYFPIFPPTGLHYTIYAIFVLAAFPVVSNAFNMMDAFNGELSGFTTIASVAIVAGILMRLYVVPGFSVDRLAVALPLVAVAGSFFLFNRYPAKVFDGDSGSLPLGAMYAAIAITGGVEIAAVVAIMPAILNSFYILSSVRDFVEHRKMSSRPTSLGEDGRLHASADEGGPSTLARLILLAGPMMEKDLVRDVMILASFAAVLSILTSGMTWLL